MSLRDQGLRIRIEGSEFRIMENHSVRKHEHDVEIVSLLEVMGPIANTMVLGSVWHWVPQTDLNMFLVTIFGPRKFHTC